MHQPIGYYPHRGLERRSIPNPINIVKTAIAYHPYVQLAKYVESHILPKAKPSIPDVHKPPSPGHVDPAQIDHILAKQGISKVPAPDSIVPIVQARVEEFEFKSGRPRIRPDSRLSGFDEDVQAEVVNHVKFPPLHPVS